MTDDDVPHEERDAMIRATLAEHGDSGITPRHTLFYFYGDGAHDDLNEVARRAGFLTRGQDDCTILETTMAVDEASFSPVSAGTMNSCEKFPPMTPVSASTGKFFKPHRSKMRL